MNKLKCLRCKHEWRSRLERRPSCCPECKCRNWDVEGYAQCQICRRYFLISGLHHKDGNRKNNSKNNLIRVCIDCHVAIHEGIGKKVKRKGGKNKIRKYGLNNIKDSRTRGIIKNLQLILLKQKIIK